MNHRSMLRLAVAMGSAALLSLAGCQTASETQTPALDTSGPPPEGHATWEDYWKAKDRDYRDFEHDVQRLEMTRQRTPGGP